jgi:hypothetical protein
MLRDKNSELFFSSMSLPNVLTSKSVDYPYTIKARNFNKLLCAKLKVLLYDIQILINGLF